MQGFWRILDKIKKFLAFPQKIKHDIYNFFKKFFPFKQIFNLFEAQNLSYRREIGIFHENMPKIYVTFDKIMEKYVGFILYFMFFKHHRTQDKFQYIIQQVFGEMDFAVWEDFLFYLGMFFSLSLTLYLFLRFILGFFFLKKIIYNSPFSFKNTGNFIINRGKIGIACIGAAFGLGTLGLDDQLIKKGYKPLVQGRLDHSFYYSTGSVTKKLGSFPYGDLEYCKDEDLFGAGKYIKKIQENDDRCYQDLHDVYVNRQRAAELRKLSDQVESKFERDNH